MKLSARTRRSIVDKRWKKANDGLFKMMTKAVKDAHESNRRFLGLENQ